MTGKDLPGINSHVAEDCTQLLNLKQPGPAQLAGGNDPEIEDEGLVHNGRGIPCEVCNMLLNGPTEYERHLGSKSHRKKVRALERLALDA